VLEQLFLLNYFLCVFIFHSAELISRKNTAPQYERWDCLIVVIGEELRERGDFEKVD
jgi:hypothetical protein